MYARTSRSTCSLVKAILSTPLLTTPTFPCVGSSPAAFFAAASKKLALWLAPVLSFQLLPLQLSFLAYLSASSATFFAVVSSLVAVVSLGALMVNTCGAGWDFGCSSFTVQAPAFHQPSRLHTRESRNSDQRLRLRLKLRLRLRLWFRLRLRLRPCH